jgi:hypothetical protein
MGVKRELDISYITPRIVAVSRTSLSSPEHVFLQEKYSNFLKTLPQLEQTELSPLSLILSIAESAAAHHFSNPVNVVCLVTPMGDPNAVLLMCAILLRVGSVYPRTAVNALDLFVKQRFSIEPDRDSLLPKCLESQLDIFERIMTRTAEHPALTLPQMFMKRVVLSNLDTESVSNLQLAIVDVESGEIREENISASASPTSLTFVCTSPMGDDTLFVFSQEEQILSKLYVNSKFHFSRMIASSSSFHHVSSFERCDHWADRFRRSSARIEIVVGSVSEFPSESKPSQSRKDKTLLSVPPFHRTEEGNCLLV